MLRQPIVIAYLATGLLLGGLGIYQISNHQAFSTFADLGVMFLLFLVGLELNYTSIKTVGKTSLLLGLGQIIFTFGIGFIIALLFHFSAISSAYIAIALTFSSTIIVVKLLSEKKEINSLYGKISVGFLLVQDFVAVLLLVVLSGLTQGTSLSLAPIALTIFKGIVLFAVMLWLGRSLIPRLFEKIGRTQELLFVISLAWVFLVAIAVDKLGFSIEIAGFLAGIALANSYENFQIASNIRPLRDFFILIFFFMLGSSVTVFNFSGIGWPIVVFSLFVLLGNPLIVLILMGSTGYRRRTSFMTGVTMAQISEFSLILAALGLKLGHIDNRVVGLITAVGVITIVCSTYLIMHGDAIVKKFWAALSLFERLNPRIEETLPDQEFNKPYILIGAQRIGHIIASHLPQDDLLIIDFDPSVVERFRKHGYTCLLGDIADLDIMEMANLEQAKMIVCTSPLFEDNMTILSELKKLGGDQKIIVRADNDHEAAKLYRRGADYVIRPHLTSGHYVGDILAKNPRGDGLWHARQRDYKYTERIRKGL